MYTYCPHCRTTFRIHPDQLAQARGQVRCGVCNHCFNALDTLSEQPVAPPPPPPPAAAPPTAEAAGHIAAPAAIEPPRAETPVTEAMLAGEAAGAEERTDISGDLNAPALGTAPPSSPTPPAAEPPSAEASAFAAAPAAAEPPPAEPPVAEAMLAEEAAGAVEQADVSGELNAPTYRGSEETMSLPPVAAEESLPDLGVIAAEPRELPETEAVPPPLWKTTLWAAANLLLILVLVGQYVYYNRQQLAQYAELRPWVAQLCAAAGCDLPLQRDVKRIALTSRLVESHPSRPNALLIDATFVNQADFTQPYPLLELRFSDLNNQLVAGRRFRPEEYLPPAASVRAGMPPHQPVHITLEIVDPGKDAVSFQFDLL